MNKTSRTSLKRRELLVAMGATALLAQVPGVAFAQGSLHRTVITDSITLITGAGANVVVAEGPESVVVIDGGLQAHAEALLAEINRISGNKPISVLFNTNWRPEHTGLNHLLGGSGTRIIAHENTRLWQTADFYVEWEDKTYLPMPDAAQVNESFYTAGTLLLGEETISYGYKQQAHTDGDLYVKFEQADVLVVSDMLSVGAYPQMDYRTGGWIGGLRTASIELADMASESTKVIAAVGGVFAKSDLLTQHEMLDVAYELVGDAYRSGWSLEEFKQSAPQEKLGSEWGDADLFLTQAYRGTWYHVPGRAVRNVV